MSRELFSLLAQVRSVSGTGPYGEIYVKDHKDQVFKAYRGNYSDAELKPLLSKWNFLKFEYRNDTLTLVKDVPCSKVISDLMVANYRMEKAKEKQEKDKIKEENVS